MEKKIARKAKRFNKVHKRKKIWHRFVSCLAVFVVFWTTYALVLPAITLDSNDYENTDVNNGIQSLKASGLETIYARIVKYDDLQSDSVQQQQFVFFAKSGNNYYAFGSSGEAIPITLTGPLQEGTLVTYTNDDVSNALWIFNRYFDTEASYNGDISIQSVKTGDYFYGNPNGFFYNSDDKRPCFFNTEGYVAPGVTLDTDIAVRIMDMEFI